jgi:hypothetical protein
MILNEPYSKELFDSFLKNFLSDYQKDERQVRTTDKSILTEVTQLGTSRDVNVTVLEAECEETDTNKRIAITQAAFKVLRDHSIRNAIIAFHDGADQWRLSLLTSTLDIKNGKVVKKDSNPRRYSYLLGVGAKTVTPYKYLIEKGKVEDIKQLQERFSVEVVNKQFYTSIANLFTKLIGGERGAIKYPGLLKLNGVVNQNVEHQEFAVRLIGRVIFSWFLKEKKSTTGVPIVPNEILSLDAVASNADYYHSVLEPLFFELLNKRMEQRNEYLREVPFSTVPYLNGGLFSPQYNDYYNQNSFNGAGTPGLTHIPDSWFTELFTVLEQYNFTVDENTSYDVDLSIDPEMLGRIFENLLAEINPETGESARKNTGSFYTPREIVDYMVDSSLLEFLKNRTGADEEKLKALISWGQSDDEQYPLTDDEKEKVVSALANLTILDPACGSGAFPIGILQKVVYVLQQVDEKAELWLQNQIKNINSPEFRRDIEEKYRNGNYDYLRKLGVIRESIFGIDIQTIATEISKLRCFLTLIIDEDVIDDEPNRGIRALPNLDFKFVTANSLINLPEDEGKHKIKGQPSMLEDTTHIDALKRIRNEYFNAPNDLRNDLKNNFYRLQKQMFETTINRFSGTVSGRYSLLSGWDPFEHKATEWFDSEWMFGIDKFDIVIANPPYVGEKGHKALFDNLKTTSLGKRFYKGKMDLFYFFFHLGLDVLREDGILTFISTNYYLTATNADKLRADYKTRATPLRFINFHELKIFESAIGQHNLITQLQKGKHATDCQTILTNRKGYPGDSSSAIPQILSGLDENTEYYNIPQSNIYNSRGFIDLKDNPISALMEDVTLKHPRVRDYYKVSEGLQTGDNKVFVFDGRPDFYNSLDEVEHQYIKPFYKNSDVKKYLTSTHATKSVLYIDKDFVPENNPRIQRYLETHHDDLANRAQIKRSKQAWYTLLWPRDVRMFTGNKIVFPYRAKTNIFSLIKDEWFSGTDTYFVYDSSRRSLELCLALLNSRLALAWLKNKGAVKGDVLELKADVVADFPIPKPNPNSDTIESQIVKIVTVIIDAKTTNMHADTSGLESEIDHLVYRLYDLTLEEISVIEEA